MLSHQLGESYPNNTQANENGYLRDNLMNLRVLSSGTSLLWVMSQS
jgi:hypothetical protein